RHSPTGSWNVLEQSGEGGAIEPRGLPPRLVDAIGPTRTDSAVTPTCRVGPPSGPRASTKPTRSRPRRHRPARADWRTRTKRNRRHAPPSTRRGTWSEEPAHRGPHCRPLIPVLKQTPHPRGTGRRRLDVDHGFFLHQIGGCVARSRPRLGLL